MKHFFNLFLSCGGRVKNLPTMPETQVWSLGWEDPLEKGMVIHSNILAWRIPWTEEPGGLQSMWLQRVGHNWATNTVSSQFLLLHPFLLFEIKWFPVLPGSCWDMIFLRFCSFPKPHFPAFHWRLWAPQHNSNMPFWFNLPEFCCLQSRALTGTLGQGRTRDRGRTGRRA